MEFILNIPLPPQREMLSVAKLRELKRLFQIIKTPSVIFSAKKRQLPRQREPVFVLNFHFSLFSSLFSARQYVYPITFDFGKRMQSVLPFGIFVSQNSVASLTVLLPYFSFIESIAFSIFSRLICFSMSKNISS